MTIQRKRAICVLVSDTSDLALCQPYEMSFFVARTEYAIKRVGDSKQVHT